MTHPRTALVIGAAGGFGHAVTTAMLNHGWQVRALTREAPPAETRPGLTWLRGDAMKPADVLAAAEGVDVVVHAAHPGGYRNWAETALPMLESAIAAARASGARLLFPGCVYNFDPQLTPVIDEASPQVPLGPKGINRIDVERRLKAAADAGTRVLILRGGDYFGPPPSASSWMSAAMFRPARPLTRVVYPGRPEVGHAWTYLPDFAETAVRLLEQEERLEPYASFHFSGHWMERGVEMAEALRRAAGAPDAPIRAFPWLAIRAMAPFNQTFRGLVEMSYLWRLPIRLDNRRLVAFLGAEPHTPLDEALRATLSGFGVTRPASANALAPAGAA